MEPVSTDLKNPNFGDVVGLKAGDLEESVRTWLAQRGPALLDVDTAVSLRFARLMRLGAGNRGSDLFRAGIKLVAMLR